jgi:serine/threonine-protein kinase HipA
MLIFGDNNLSQLKTCIDTAHNFGLTKKQALELINSQESTIKKYWKVVCEEAELTEIDSKLFWKRQFLNPFSCIKE